MTTLEWHMYKREKNTSTEVLKLQVGYNKYLVREFKCEAEMLQLKYYGKVNKPTAEQIEELEEVEYTCGYYFTLLKDIITELKKKKRLRKNYCLATKKKPL